MTSPTDLRSPLPNPPHLIPLLSPLSSGVGPDVVVKHCVCKNPSMPDLSAVDPPLSPKDSTTPQVSSEVPRLFGIVRHTERADDLGATVNGDAWVLSADFQSWSMDPPLSDNGIAHASQIGQQLASLAEEAMTQIDVVISSPYRRCVQTAVELCRCLGRETKMILDMSFGEVFGPPMFGEVQPSSPLVTEGKILAYCADRGVKCQSGVLGKAPRWPETLLSARRRLAERFLIYLNRSAAGNRNFVIVTHADGVGAALSMMPCAKGYAVDTVAYGGGFTARRVPQLVSIGRSASWDGPARGRSFSDAIEDVLSPSENLVENAEGWDVQIHGVNLQAWRDNATSFEVRLDTMARTSRFSKAHIQDLLCKLSNEPLCSGAELRLNGSFWSARHSKGAGVHTLGQEEKDSDGYISSPTTPASPEDIDPKRAASFSHWFRVPTIPYLRGQTLQLVAESKEEPEAGGRSTVRLQSCSKSRLQARRSQTVVSP